MPFEVFDRLRMPSTQDPAVTIQKRGALSLNNAAFEALDSPERVELLFDREEKLIGLLKAAKASPNAYLVRAVGKNGATHVISGKSFLTYYGIPLDVARRWIAEKRDDLLVIDLKQPGLEVTGHSSRLRRGGG
jgi:hypothetical protein